MRSYLGTALEQQQPGPGAGGLSIASQILGWQSDRVDLTRRVTDFLTRTSRNQERRAWLVADEVRRSG